MNEDMLNHLPAEEQPIASKLDDVADDMKLSPSFQWQLENQLIDAHQTKSQPSQSWQMKIIPVLGWVVVAIGAIVLLNWGIRSQTPDVSPAAAETSGPEMSFETNIRQGNICAGPLAAAHGFAVFLTNDDKTGFVPLDPGKTIGELRSFTWSPNGELLAMVGNTTGRGNIYFTNPAGGRLEYHLYSSEIGYVMDAAWSRDGKQLLMWSSQNNKVVYVVNTDGSGLVEKQLDLQILGTPQFTPDGESIVFYGADPTSAGLFEATLANEQIRMISPQVEDESGYAFSPAPTRLPYFEMDRGLGEARLVAEEFATENKVVIATLPILKGAGSAIPESANLSWSKDGSILAFEFGRGEADRAVYIAYADGTGLVKAADSAHAPAISTDGKCLAYISDKQVFLLDLSSIASTSTSATPVLLADLPTGRGIPDFRLDKLQWKP